jgi:hypothetical protein
LIGFEKMYAAREVTVALEVELQRDSQVRWDGQLKYLLTIPPTLESPVALNLLTVRNCLTFGDAAPSLGVRGNGASEFSFAIMASPGSYSKRYSKLVILSMITTGAPVAIPGHKWLWGDRGIGSMVQCGVMCRS